MQPTHFPAIRKPQSSFPLWAVPLVLMLGAAGCSAPQQRSLVGIWRSDAPRTLASMRAAPGIPEPVRAALEDDYYGHLVVEYRADTVRAYFDDAGYDSGYQPYQVVATAADRIVTREWNEILEEFADTTTYFDGECIFGIAAQFDYREYFCPLAN